MHWVALHLSNTYPTLWACHATPQQKRRPWLNKGRRSSVAQLYSAAIRYNHDSICNASHSTASHAPYPSNWLSANRQNSIDKVQDQDNIGLQCN
jgi:hypothetical protein